MKTVPNHKNRKKLLILTAPHEKILRAAHFYRFLLTTDICRLYWSLSSLTYVRDLLANLAKNKYLYRFAHPSLSRGGVENTYTLGCKGREYVEKILGLPGVDWYYRPHKIRHASYGAVLHNLILSRTLIAASLWAKKQPNFKLVKTLCYELAREAPSIELTNGKGEREMVKVIPDAYLLFQKLNNNKHERFYQILLELDRGTEFKKRFVKSIRARLEFIKDSEAYRRLLGMAPKNVIIAYITTGDRDRPEYRESRRRAMCNWAKEVL